MRPYKHTLKTRGKGKVIAFNNKNQKTSKPRRKRVRESDLQKEHKPPANTSIKSTRHGKFEDHSIIPEST